MSGIAPGAAAERAVRLGISADQAAQDLAAAEAAFPCPGDRVRTWDAHSCVEPISFDQLAIVTGAGAGEGRAKGDESAPAGAHCFSCWLWWLLLIAMSVAILRWHKK